MFREAIKCGECLWENGDRCQPGETRVEGNWERLTHAPMSLLHNGMEHFEADAQRRSFYVSFLNLSEFYGRKYRIVACWMGNREKVNTLPTD